MKQILLEQNQVKVYLRIWADGMEEGPRPKVSSWISWGRPLEVGSGLTRMGSGGGATSTGVLRDGSGQWLGGFLQNLGSCLVPTAELWSIRSGLQLTVGTDGEFALIPTQSWRSCCLTTYGFVSSTL